ncbi:dipeptidase PepV [Hutsoniella sourekii]
MTINFKQEVEQRKDELIADLFRLLKIDSVRRDDLATEEAPVGPGPKAALDEFIQMAQEDHFDTQVFGPWAGRLEIGQGDELLGILGHVDVVPVGNGWETDPFDPQIIDGRIYARGASDDKGPTVAAYFAIKILRDLGVEFNKRIHLIVGTDEESGWQCMDYYFQHAEMPDFGFSPDAEFPIINGEKGNVSLIMSDASSQEQAGDFHLVSLKGGLRPNMVPQEGQAILEAHSGAGDIQPALEAFLGKYPEIQAECQQEGDKWILDFVGKSAHGSTPEKGVNALTYLANFLSDLTWDNQLAQDLLQALAGPLFQQFDGSGLGIDHVHPVMGPVSMNVGIVKYQADAGLSMDVNLRFPQGTDPETILKQAQETLASYPSLKLALGEAKEPHYVPADDPLVETLLEVYTDHTGLPGHEVSIGGGTYGRLMPRGVAYGALFPDSIDTMHQANEFISVDDLLKATAIYADAIYRLTR